MKNQNYTEFLKSKEARVEAQGIEPGPVIPGEPIPEGAVIVTKKKIQEALETAYYPGE